MAIKPNQSIQKAAALLRAVARHPEGVTASALARTLSYPRATVARLLATLEAEGLVQRLAGDDRYVLGFEFIQLGRRIDPHRALILRAADALQDLARELKETVTMSVVRDDRTLDLVLQYVGPHLVADTSWIGQRFPHHASSSGKLLLAELPADEVPNVLTRPPERLTAKTVTDIPRLLGELELVRVSNCATAIDELEDGLAALSVGLRDIEGRLIAIVGVSGPTFRFDQDARARAVDALRPVIEELQGFPARATLPTFHSSSLDGRSVVSRL
jgi:DNA-binding IclR family transcriptional regulator